ncbi:MAG TPA: Rossmann-like and DUF2520 domain-containing protein [Pyrinomonadaceae bacterium]|jgi:predicted short-subunit dehydrogenase-like oxidoreductase (DUF2520 family)|nr:Rossmann-like and DUF2520 domain-containing protein [Pyrinomonadaceae bacterium]
MPPEQKNRSAKKSKTANRKTPEATAQKATTRNVTTRKTTTRKLTTPQAASRKATAQQATVQQAKKPRARSASRSASSTSASTTRPASSTLTALSTRPASSKRPTVALVGAGRLGSALALALSQSGYRVLALVARRAQHARRAACTLSPEPLALGATELDSLPDTDLLLITTPDDEIAGVAAHLASVFASRDANASPRPQRRRPARVALHASGALVSGALAPLAAHAFSLGSLHPLVSISDTVSGASNLRGAFYCLEGEARALSAAKEIVRALGGRSFSIAARHKPLYHAAAVMSAGHLVALFSLATGMLAQCGLTERQASRVLLPLAGSTLENLSRSKLPAGALTGPFARADVATLRRHLAALRGFDTRETLPVYVALGRHALRLARARGGDAASRAALAEIEALLEEAS